MVCYIVNFSVRIRLFDRFKALMLGYLAIFSVFLIALKDFREKNS